MKTIIISIIVIYCLVCLIFYLFQYKLLYMPQPAGDVDLEVGVIEEIEYFNGEQKLSGWLLNPRKPKALIYYGGNASAVEVNIEFLMSIAPDYSIYMVPYRGYGNNDGQPNEKALYSDALYILDQIINNHESVSLMGRSLGSGVASYVAANRTIDKLVLSTPYDSLTEAAQDYVPYLPVKLFIKDHFPSVERAKDFTAKTLIVIAAEDEIIHPKRSEILAEHVDPKLLTKVIIPKAKHNDISDFKQYGESIKSFLAE